VLQLTNQGQSEISEEAGGAKGICRGAIRLLRAHGYACALEITLKSGRRADILAIGPTGEILIVEVKSSVADFQADKKWTEYHDYCERLLFAVAQGFPTELIPPQVGLIVCDEYSGAIIRDGDLSLIAPARRKSIILSVARVCSDRLSKLNDPYC